MGLNAVKGTHLREIRGFDRINSTQPASRPGRREDEAAGAQRAAGVVTTRECQALFAYWRSTVMGHRRASQKLTAHIAGYFFTGSPPSGVGHRPLGEVRRSLLTLLDRADLTDDERTVIRLYCGLDGLPLPFASKSTPDIAGGRDESSPRGTCWAGIAKIAPHVAARPLAAVPERGVVDPLTEPWFQARVRPSERRSVVARAWVRAMSQCDGPHGPPTVAALVHWYGLSGYADPDLQQAASIPSTVADTGHPRPNTNARHRAAALMEIALYEEVRALPEPTRVAVPHLPAPHPGPADSRRLPETVTHPLLMALLTDDLSPDDLVAAAAVLQDRAVNGIDVSGRTTLFLRYLRPRIHDLSGYQLERLAVSMSYVAATQGNPFLALEWLGVFLSRVGITDRTFTVMVNTIEAAAEGGYHGLAVRADRFFGQLRMEWRVPAHQVPFVEHFEAEQQRLAARAYRLERLGRAQARMGDTGRAAQSLQRSVAVASRSSRMAEQVLVDRSTFPTIELDGKAGGHGGDLTWSWALAAAACIVEPLDQLHAGLTGSRDDQATEAQVDLTVGSQITAAELAAPARLARSLLDDYEGPLGCTRYRTWYEQIDAVTARVLATVG